MDIFTALCMMLALIVPTALLEGARTMRRKAKQAREWREIRKAYYPPSKGVST